jgi:release factor glutamine methyltransferase
MRWLLLVPAQGFCPSSRSCNMETLLSILQKTTVYFNKFGITTPKLDAELLLAHVLGCKRMQLYLDFDRPMTEEILGALRPLVRRRAAREPIQYLLGKEGFLDFEVVTDRRGLIPRPETEELVQWVIESVTLSPGASILDAGTGSGVIACALARAFPTARVTASDLDPETLGLARDNVIRMGLQDRIELLQSDWFASLVSGFDLIVSNPPYLSEEEFAEVEPELSRYEPRGALVSGPAGLECIRTLIEGAGVMLNPGASLFLEIGHSQAAGVRELVGKNPGWQVEVRKDLSGKERFARILAPAQ